MKGLLSLTPGGPETLVLGALPDPVAGPGELLVRVAAAAINYPDVLIIEDRYQYKPARPFAPGSEIAGTVAAIGAGVAGWAIGDRLIAQTRYGGLVEQIAIPAEAAFRLPAAHSLIEGSALLVTYATTLYALRTRGRLNAGETLLVLGAAGGIGLAAVELGKALGARVVAAVSSEEKAAIARGAGADVTLLYGHTPFDKVQSRALADAFKATIGDGGADVIFDPVGGDYAEPALRSIAWYGRYLVIGFAAGIARLPMNLTLLKSCDVCGVFWGEYARRDPASYAADVEQLFAFWAAGQISPRITETFPLAEGGAAIARLGARGAIGKLVVTIDG